MGKKEGTVEPRRFDPILTGGAILAALVLLVGSGLLVWALFSLNPAGLRWWAGVATVGALAGPILGYAAGHATARAHREGIQTGVGVVMQAATQTAEVRVRTVQAMRAPQRPPAPERENPNLYLPTRAGLEAPVIEALPFDDDGEIEMF